MLSGDLFEYTCYFYAYIPDMMPDALIFLKIYLDFDSKA